MWVGAVGVVKWAELSAVGVATHHSMCKGFR